MKHFKFYSISIAVIILLTAWGLSVSVESVDVLKAVNGNLDLGTLGSRQIVEVGGSWQYYDSQLYEDLLATQADPAKLQPAQVEIPHIWQDHPDAGRKPYGYATYTATISGLDPGKYYAVQLNDEGIAYRLWLNGEILMGCGQVGRTRQDYQPGQSIQWTAFKPDPNGQAQLVMEIANYDSIRGGFWLAPRIGEFKTISRMVSRHILIDIFLFASMLIMGLFFFALHARSGNEGETLLLGVFSVLVAFRGLFTGYRLIVPGVPSMNWQFYSRMEFIIGFLLLPVAGFMVMALGYVKPRRFLRAVFWLLLAIAVLLPLLTPSAVYFEYYEIYKYLVLALALYILFVLLAGIRRRKEGSIAITLAFLSIIIGSVAELFIGNLPYVVGFSTFVMIAIFELVQIVTFYSIKEQKETLETEIIIDKLTSVYNRLYLEQMVSSKTLLSQPRHRSYVLFIDVNRFKQINDTYGHSIGDQVLSQVARILKQSLRDDDLIFRYGGDEFVILLYLEEHQDPRMVCERIHAGFKTPLALENLQLPVSLSIGLTEYRPEQESLYEAIQRSDEEMYKIKHGVQENSPATSAQEQVTA